MKKLLFLVLMLIGLMGHAMPHIDPALRAEMNQRDEEEKIKINILLKEQANAEDLIRKANWLPTKQERRTFVIETLKRQAETSQQALLETLEALEHHDLVSEIRPLWLVNSISCQATSTAILSLEERPDIMIIFYCEKTRCLDEETTLAIRDNGREITENLLQVNVDKVWELGYTGEGVLIAIIDTGVSLTHADLQGRFWEGGEEFPNHGYDFADHDYDPSDAHGHGTHVAGTLCGTGAAGTQTGVAPDAKIMVLKVFGTDQQTDATVLVDAMQFAVEHGADLLNMSLGWPDPNAAVKLLMRQACDNTLAVGMVAAVCAGNIRHLQNLVPIPRNIYSPGDCPPPYLHEDQMVNAGGISCVISVGAVDYDDQITYFSSVGPSIWTDVLQYNDYPYNPESPTEIGLIRPDLCAPGMDIKSLDYADDHGYCLMEGTSMATPCVAGTIALMLSKNRELTPAQIDEILEHTAIPLSEHKNNDFGSGRIDALAAIEAVEPDAINEETSAVSIYPNPSSETFTIRCEGMRQVSIYSLDGKMVKSMKTNHSQCLIEEHLKSGVYLLKIETEEHTLLRKIVKM